MLRGERETRNGVGEAVFSRTQRRLRGKELGADMVHTVLLIGSILGAPLRKKKKGGPEKRPSTRDTDIARTKSQSSPPFKKRNKNNPPLRVAYTRGPQPIGDQNELLTAPLSPRHIPLVRISVSTRNDPSLSIFVVFCHRFISTSLPTKKILSLWKPLRSMKLSTNP